MKLALVPRPPSPSTLHQRRGRGLSLPQHYIRGGGEASLSLNTTSEEGEGEGEACGVLVYGPRPVGGKAACVVDTEH